nr:DUF1961 family protein [Jiangella asiatica]
MGSYRITDQIYRNPLASDADVEGFRLEGHAEVSFPRGRMRMANVIDPAEGQRANFVFWCPEEFPEDIAVSWNVWPLREPGLCMLFFAATGRNGEDIFDPGLEERTGEYHQYHHGQINAFHVSYFRRKLREERAFHACNLRKSYGFDLVATGADPIPDVDDADPPYRLLLVKCGPYISFSINDLPIFSWHDDGQRHGPRLGGGRIGFRQMAPLLAEYDNLEVHRVQPA